MLTLTLYTVHPHDHPPPTLQQASLLPGPSFDLHGHSTAATASTGSEAPLSAVHQGPGAWGLSPQQQPWDPQGHTQVLTWNLLYL